MSFNIGDGVRILEGVFTGKKGTIIKKYSGTITKPNPEGLIDGVDMPTDNFTTMSDVEVDGHGIVTFTESDIEAIDE